MSKSISLTIKMNNPCHEDWNNMEPTEQGRFCNACKKQVVNFTHFTDQQVLQYFLEHPYPVCGRILPAQLDTSYEHTTSRANRTLTPVAATLLTLASITSEAAPSTPITHNPPQEQVAFNQQVPGVLTDSVSISGTVKDQLGKPIENAAISCEQVKILTDKNGNFRFTLPPGINKPAVIQFSYGKLEPTVRSYHPVMGSTTYDVTLYEGYMPGCQIMGLMQPSLNVPDSLTTYSFQSAARLNMKTKVLLTLLAAKLIDDPHQRIVLHAYYKRNKQQANKLINLVKDYLEAEGLSTERILITDPLLLEEIQPQVIIEFMAEM